MKNNRTTFHGDDEDYQYPYYHRYDEPDSDRGASDEFQDERLNDANKRNARRSNS